MEELSCRKVRCAIRTVTQESGQSFLIQIPYGTAAVLYVNRNSHICNLQTRPGILCQSISECMQHVCVYCMNAPCILCVRARVNSHICEQV